MGSGDAITDLGLDDIRTGLADGSILLVDVREPHEYDAGHIPGSVSMPLSRFEPAALAGMGSGRVVFSCAAGVRSRVAIEASRRAGLPLGEHYAGGFRDWSSAGEPVEQGAP